MRSIRQRVFQLTAQMGLREPPRPIGQSVPLDPELCFNPETSTWSVKHCRPDNAKVQGTRGALTIREALDLAEIWYEKKNKSKQGIM